MGRLEKMKERYDEIPIPEELDGRIRQEITKSRRLQAKKNRAGRRLKTVIRSMEAAAAAVCVLFTAALNTSPVRGGGGAVPDNRGAGPGTDIPFL